AQLTDDPPVAQAAFSPARRTTRTSISRSTVGRPGRRCAYVQRRATNRWCQRRSVRGLTEKADQVRRGNARLNAAKNTRSASRSCGRRSCRRRIESSCRNTRISSSFDPDERQQMTISWNKRRTTKYANDHSTRDLQQTGKATLTGRYLDNTDRSDRVFEPHALAGLACEGDGIFRPPR